MHGRWHICPSQQRRRTVPNYIRRYNVLTTLERTLTLLATSESTLTVLAILESTLTVLTDNAYSADKLGECAYEATAGMKNRYKPASRREPKQAWSTEADV